MIIAGSETSATLLSGCIFYLCKHQMVMTQLIKEIRNAFRQNDDITFARTSKLTYLAAVLQESLRMYPPFVTSLARTTPRGGDTVDGHWIPGNVTPPFITVSCRPCIQLLRKEMINVSADNRCLPPLRLLSLHLEFRSSQRVHSRALARR